MLIISSIFINVEKRRFPSLWEKNAGSNIFATELYFLKKASLLYFSPVLKEENCTHVELSLFSDIPIRLKYLREIEIGSTFFLNDKVEIESKNGLKASAVKPVFSPIFIRLDLKSDF